MYPTCLHESPPANHVLIRGALYKDARFDPAEVMATSQHVVAIPAQTVSHRSVGATAYNSFLFDLRDG